MAIYKLGVLYGDGIGPEIVKSRVDIFTAGADRRDGAKFDFEQLAMGWEGIEPKRPMARHRTSAGKNIGNPTGILLSTVMLLDWLNSRYNDPQLDDIARLVE